jgi:hypothetical protein
MTLRGLGTAAAFLGRNPWRVSIAPLILAVEGWPVVTLDTDEENEQDSVRSTDSTISVLSAASSGGIE